MLLSTRFYFTAGHRSQTLAVSAVESYLERYNVKINPIRSEKSYNFYRNNFRKSTMVKIWCCNYKN